MHDVCSTPTYAILKQRRPHDAAYQIEEAERLGVRILSLADPAYPSLLRLIPDPPPLLFIKGRLCERSRSIACVGTRTPTAWGRTIATRITSELAQHSYSIVSGLALGIDAIAHTTALREGGHTLAVLPCPLDQLYPSSHRALAEQIISQGGALLSELPFGKSVCPSSFVRRNRLISGLCDATIIIQSASQSGTMHTARFATQYARPLFVTVPPAHMHSEHLVQGNLALLQRDDVLPLYAEDSFLQQLTAPLAMRSIYPQKAWQMRLF